MPSSYRIVDEPRPGQLSQVATAPFWPLLGLMLGGAWLAWPWFLLNGAAIGSANRRREVSLVGCGFVGSIVLGLLMLRLLDEETSGWAVSLWVLGLQIVKLGVGYWLFNLQARSFALFEYFGGRPRNAFLIVAAGAYLRSTVLSAVSWPLWILVMA